jgi:hypothetical protein
MTAEGMLNKSGACWWQDQVVVLKMMAFVYTHALSPATSTPSTSTPAPTAPSSCFFGIPHLVQMLRFSCLSVALSLCLSCSALLLLLRACVAELLSA